MVNDQSTPPQLENKPGCGNSFVYVMVLFWILACVIGGQFAGWIIDELRFEGGSGPGYTLGRFIAELGWSITILVVTLPLSIFLQKSPFRMAYIAFSLSAGFAIILSPIRLLGMTQAQMANVLQISLGSIFILVMLISFRRITNRSMFDAGAWKGTCLALLGSGITAIPWLLWGALGSWLDTVLNILAGITLGMVLVSILTTARAISEKNEVQKATILPEFWFVLSVFGIASILSCAYGTLGMEILLMIGFIGISPGVAALLRREDSSGVLAAVILAGLAAIFPLTFFDPDELAAILADGSREIVSVALRSGIVALIFALISGLGIHLISKYTEKIPVNLIRIIAAVVWIFSAAAYSFLGQPGFYGEEIFIVMKNQADVSSAEKLTDPVEKRSLVYHTLVDYADQTQMEIRKKLDGLGIQYKSYYLVNGIRVNAGPILRLWLRNQPEVDRILDNPILRPLPQEQIPAEGTSSAPETIEWNLTQIHADQVWKEFGDRGAGIVVGHADSGVQGDHTELADSYRGADGNNDYNWLDPWNGSEAPQDIGGHGTHTLGTILGNTTGVAPDATWFGCSNLARNLGNPSLYLECMQFLLAPYPQEGNPFTDGDPTLGANVISNSWGCPEIEGCDPEALQPAAKALRAAGIFLAVSAGNSGSFGCNTVSDPLALYSEVYTVGAVDINQDIAGFSSQGPANINGQDILKPDIMAPGYDVLSAFPGNTYEIASGTSMASPHVAGVVVLMWSANPKLIGQIDATIQILNDTAQPYQGTPSVCSGNGETPNNATGWGEVDAYQAVKEAIAY